MNSEYKVKYMSNIEIRKACPGDEKILAYIQTESWKAAFADILSAEELTRCTDTAKAEEMYRRVIETGRVSMIIEYADGRPHGIAAWGANRCDMGENVAELICIHSLPDKWRMGYGSVMMSHVLEQMKQAGYSDVILWVFEDNARARRFYEKHGFTLTEQAKQANGITEVMYSRKLG